MKKILIITPRSPFEGKGADEQDRLSGIRWFIEHSWDVRVITKVLPTDVEYVERTRKDLGINITAVSYKSKRDFKTILKRLLNPMYWDGAAYEYFDEEVQKAAMKEADEFHPDIVWFDYTYLWPLYPIFKKRGIPIITRSINFEPSHFLDEDGRNPVNFLRALPKLYSEWRSSRDSNLVLAITPSEEKKYLKLGAKVLTLPLRGLPHKLTQQEKKIAKTEEVAIGFTASNYNVHHNLAALKFLLREVLPRLKVKFKFRFTGAKLPKDMEENLPSRAFYLGFVPNLDEFWGKIDIAVMPSLFGSGMQQKIFEPLAKGVPTVTSHRAIAGYLFKEGIHYMGATTSNEFVDAIYNLSSDLEKRKALSKHARELSCELFSKKKIDQIIEEGIKIALNEKAN